MKQRALGWQLMTIIALGALVLSILQSPLGSERVEAAGSTSGLIQKSGVGDPSWPAKCPEVIDTQNSDQPEVVGFTFNGERFTRLSDGLASATSAPENVIGCYADLNSFSGSGGNSWQIGTISRDSTGYYWLNAAGAKWGLSLSSGKMITDKRNPYYATAQEFTFATDPSLKYFGALGVAGSIAVTGGPGYYVSAPIAAPIPSTNTSGFGWYSTLFPLIAHPVQGFQLGLSSTWITPENTAQTQAIAQKLCATSTNDWVKSAASNPSNGTYGYDLMQTLEGSLGWWAGEKYPSSFPKYQANATQNCYTSQLATPGWGFFSDEPTARDSTGLIQLSNQLILPPDGMTFQADSGTPQLGVTWLSLPLPTFDHKYGNMAGGNSWTLFMKTGNFSGPVQFVAPQFWADGSATNPTQKGITLDSRNGSIGQLSSEWNSIPYYEAKASDGTIYSKLPQLQLPSDSKGQLPFSRDLTAYAPNAVATGVENSLKSGAPLPINAEPSGVKAILLNGQSSQAYQHGDSIPYLTQLLTTNRLDSGSAFGFTLPENNSLLQLPQYFASKNGVRTPVAESSVPSALAAASFAPTSKPTFVYQSPSWWNASPSASQTFSVQLNDGSIVEYRWYKFVDQPALQRFELNDAERSSLQATVEKIQKDWVNSQVIKNPSSGTLANFDGGLLVNPPKGLELGYVPIVSKQYFGTPKTTVTLMMRVISCVKGKLTKVVSGLNPKCPTGFKGKK